MIELSKAYEVGWRVRGLNQVDYCLGIGLGAEDARGLECGYEGTETVEDLGVGVGKVDGYMVSFEG